MLSFVLWREQNKLVLVERANSMLPRKIRQTSARKQTFVRGPAKTDPLQSLCRVNDGSQSTRWVSSARSSFRGWEGVEGYEEWHYLLSPLTCAHTAPRKVSWKPPAESNPKQRPRSSTRLRLLRTGGESMKYFSHQNEEEQWMSRSS